MKEVVLFFAVFVFLSCAEEIEEDKAPPNILFAISDDQSFVHTSYLGSKFVNTPGFDKVVRSGAYFTNCLAGSPGCAPSRSTIVTGRYHWQNQQSGQHASGWLTTYRSFVDALSTQGYHTGYTGKGVGPFQYHASEADSFRVENAAGKAYNVHVYSENNDERPATAIRNNNYAANFHAFLKQREENQPFFFWFGASEPHRAYELGAGKRLGKKLEDVEVPAFLPDVDIVRSDMLDYAVEIEWFDNHLSRMIKMLDSLGELDNTIVIVTADNGMPFPRAKANGYEYGIHVPMAIGFGGVPAGRTVEDPISFVDLAPTILDLCKVAPMNMLPMSGQSFSHLIGSTKSGTLDHERYFAFSGRERHSSSRYLNWGYPQRMIRDQEHLLIWNQRPERWPAGAPQRINPSTNELWPMYGLDEEGVHHSEWAFTDVDACPTKSYLVEHMNTDTIRPYFDLSYAKRPEFELFDILSDPACLNNLYNAPTHSAVSVNLKNALIEKLRQTEDPRVVGPDPEIFDSYVRYSRMREFPPPAVD